MTEHILVIRLSAMGDCAMAVPVLLRFHKAYPRVKLTVLTKPFFKPIFTTLPREINVLTAETEKEHRGVFGVVKLGFQLRKKGFTVVADIHNVLRSIIIRNILALFGIKFKAIDKGRREKKALTRQKNKIFKPLKTSSRRYADVFRLMGYPIDLSEEVELIKPPLSNEIRSIVGKSTQKWLGVAPFAAHQSKTYPPDLIKKVIAELNRSGQCKILFFGGGKEENDVLNGWAADYENAVCVAGKLSFNEEIALIAHIDAMVSMDSGNGHLAAIYDIPVLTLWGVTHPYGGFAPFNQPKSNQLLPDLKKYPLLPASVYGKTQIPGYEEVMRSIPPERVTERIKEMLNLETV